MNKVPLAQIPEDVPTVLRPLLENAAVYDSSCSSQAQVLYIEKDAGFFLKTAPKGTLHAEAEMTRYFYSRGLAPEVLDYTSGDRDWLLTVKLAGNDCLNPLYLENPTRLCDTLAACLRLLHSIPTSGCPANSTKSNIEAAITNYKTGCYDASHFPDNWGYATPEEAFAALEIGIPYLKSDVLVHGDYCLPNILLDNWQFSGFIDVGRGGLGDRHIDLFWGIWSLEFNLKTSQYRERFLDAYGREDVEPEKLRTIAALEVFG